MEASSIYLRGTCVLPPGVAVTLGNDCDGWRLVEDIAAHALERMTLESGWHFMWIAGNRNQRGLGRSLATARQDAICRALKKVNERYNAAELSREAAFSAGPFWCVHADFQPRHIQERFSFSPL